MGQKGRRERGKGKKNQAKEKPSVLKFKECLWISRMLRYNNWGSGKGRKGRRRGEGKGTARVPIHTRKSLFIQTREVNLYG